MLDYTFRVKLFSLLHNAYQGAIINRPIPSSTRHFWGDKYSDFTVYMDKIWKSISLSRSRRISADTQND